ncbi:raffinose synthase sip1 [Botrytis cinerea]
MTAQVICYPLLGQTTVIAEKQVNITVALSPDNDEETNWEAALWYGSEDMSWKQLDLARSDDIITIFAAEPKNSVLFFTNTLQQQSLNGQRAFYTIKYRKSGDSTWKWVNDDPNPVGNAEIIFQSATVPSSSIEEYISSLSVDLHVEYNGQHGASNSPVWTLKYPIHAPVASATESSIRRTTIGFPKHVNGSIEFVGKNENEQQRDGTIICAVGKTVEEGPTLTSTTLLAALDDLGNSSIYPSTIIIDDGWQSTTPFGSETFPNQHRWSRFEASSTSFPEGLGDLSLRIRKSYPWIRNIGVWHGIFGYWGGIEPESEIGRKYKLRWVEINNTRRSGMWVIDVCDVRRFYDDFYSFLVDSGINAVKLDTQGLLDDLKNAKDRRELIPAYQDAIHASLLSHFEDRVISCMSQYPANIFSPQILLSSSAHPANKIAMRNSDDFWPNDPATHAW